MMIVFDVAGLPVTQLRFEVITHRTLSPFAGLYVKVCELVPAFTPFTFHWYTGVVPPFIGVALNVTDVPGQKGLDDAVTVTPAERFELTIIVITFDDAGLPVVHCAPEVRIQRTRSPFAGL